jgi:putative phosphoribosyl transferase
MNRTPSPAAVESEVGIPVGRVGLIGDLSIAEGSQGIVVFAHGSGSGRHSPRNRFVAGRLQAAGLATLLVDLLTEEEEEVDEHTAHLRFDIGMLAERLVGICDWLGDDDRTADLAVGYFGASTGGGAALVAAAQQPERVAAVVSRGGRPDLAGAALPSVRAPTLLIVGSRDEVVLRLNEDALKRLGARRKDLIVVPGATHLFEEPGKLEVVAQLAAEWFTRHLSGGGD